MGGGWSPIRDTLESAASVAGNYFLPGSSLVTDQLVSKGSQEQLGSTIGQIAQIGSGFAGAGIGSSLTGIPAASDIGAGWGGLGKALGLTGPGGLFGSATEAAGSGATAPVSGGAPGTVPPGVGSAGAAGAASGGAGAIAAPTALDTSSISGFDTMFQDPYAAGAASMAPSTAAAATAPAAAAGATASNSGVALAKSLFDGQKGTTGEAFKNFLSNNANLAIPAATLGLAATKNSQQPAEFGAIKNQADQLAKQGQELSGYLQSGTLPSGLQSAVQQSLAAEQASIRSRYASHGMSGSSAEQQDLASAAARSQAQSAQLATGLLQTGVAETGDAAGLYNSLIQNIQKSDSGLESALAAFAAAASGSGGDGKTINLHLGT